MVRGRFADGDLAIAVAHRALEALEELLERRARIEAAGGHVGVLAGVVLPREVVHSQDTVAIARRVERVEDGAAAREDGVALAARLQPVGVHGAHGAAEGAGHRAVVDERRERRRLPAAGRRDFVQRREQREYRDLL